MLTQNVGAQISELWRQRYDGPAHRADAGEMLAITPDGNVVVAGASQYSSNFSDIYTVKYDAQTGAILWQRRSHGSVDRNDRVFSIACDSEGNVLIAGWRDGVTTNLDFYVAKYAGGDGALIWERSFDGGVSRQDILFSVGIDAQGDVMTTGTSRRTDFSPIESDIHTYKLAGSSGATLWENRFNSSTITTSTDGPRMLAVDAGGNVAVTGFGYNQRTGVLDPLTLYLSGKSGELLWQKVYFESSAAGGQGEAIAIDESGDILVGATLGGSVRVIKYTPESGNVVWVNSYTNPNSAARDVTVDAAGNVVVTGFTRSAAANEDFLTRKIQGGTGATLWTKLYDAGNPVSGLIKDDQAMTVAIDSSGNAFVAGFARYSSDGDADFAIIKYKGTDGTLLFEQRVAASRGEDAPRGPQSLAVTAGRIIVTGSTSTTASNLDMFTISFSDGPRDPQITTLLPTNITASSATLRASVTANSLPTAVEFFIDQRTAGSVQVPAGPGTIVTLNVAMLRPHTTYTVTTRASNGAGAPVDGGAITFMTGNSAPEARNDTIHATAPVTVIDPLTNDTDADGDPLTITLATNGTRGSVQHDGLRLTYTTTPGVGFHGSDAFSYSVSDGFGGTATATVTLVNAAPSAGTITRHANIGPGEVGTFDILEAIDDADDDVLQLVDVTNGLHGMVRIEGMRVIYGPADAAYTGNDTFTYTVRDGAGAEATGTIMLTNTAPIAADDSFRIENGPAILPVLQNDADSDDDSLKIVSVTGARAGTVSTDGAVITYFPSSTFAGREELTYTVSDSRGLFASAVVAIRASYPITRTLAQTGAQVAGLPHVRWLRFGMPSIFAGGSKAGWRANVARKDELFTGVFSGDLDAPLLRLRTGDPVPDRDGKALPGLTFAHFDQPVFGGEDFAVRASVTGSGADRYNAIGIWVRHDKLRAVARTADRAPGVLGGRFRSFLSLALPNEGTVFFTAHLWQGLGDVTATTELGLWRWAETGTQLLLRQGQSIEVDRKPHVVRSFRVLAPPVGSAGHPRYDESAQSIDAKITLTNGEIVSARIGGDGRIQILEVAPGIGRFDANPRATGLPTSPGDGTLPFALLQINPGAPASAPATGIFDFERRAFVVKQNDPVPQMQNAHFSKFRAPVSGLNQDGQRLVAFEASASEGTGRNVVGIWSQTSGDADGLKLGAQRGGAADGVAGATFARFQSLSVVEGTGPLFVADFAPNESGASESSARGCWAIGSDGAVHLLVRTGESIEGHLLRNFDLLAFVRGSPGQRRAWASNATIPSVIYRALFSDGSEAILTATIP